MKVESVLGIIEVDGNDVPFSEKDSCVLRVHSHWNRESLVVLEVDGKKFTVDGRSLRMAVDHATNWK